MTPEQQKKFKYWQWRTIIGTMVGYIFFYLIRKNFSFAMPGLTAEYGITKASLGGILSLAGFLYGLSKLLNGMLADRINGRWHMVTGLAVSTISAFIIGYGAEIITYFTGVPEGSTPEFVGKFVILLSVLWIINNIFQGCGFPPCSRLLPRWVPASELSTKMSIWNTAHNVGSSSMSWLAGVGGVVLVACGFGAEESWRATFIIPSIAALLIALMCWIFIRDTPESCGLPPIDKYRNDFSGAKAKKGEEDKIPFKTLFVDYVLKNKMLWFIGLANILVYLVRYGISDWLPIYLQQVHGITKAVSKDLYAYHMLAAIPGTLIAGWLSSRFFQGRCAPVNVICMAVTALGAFIYWQAEPLSVSLGIEYLTLVTAALIITGFGVYGPVAMISIQAIAIVPKNAAGTAAGFMGLLGYLIGDAILSKIAFGRIVEIGKHGWEITFIGFFVASVVAAIICFIAMGKEKKMFADRIAAAKAEQK